MSGSDRSSLAQWMTVLGLALGPAVSNGIGRFAYGLILPAMQTDLNWTYAEAGGLNTANALGYLAGSLWTMRMIDRLGAARLFMFGLVVTTGALVAAGLASDYWILSFWRALAGLSGAPVFIAGGALALGLFRDSPNRAALAIALYFSGGGGFGLLVSGLPVPLILDHFGAAAWPSTWLLLGSISAVASIIAILAARTVPPPPTSSVAMGAAPLPLRAMAPELLGYFLFGVGYVVHMTFFVAWMRVGEAGAGLVALTWSMLAIGVIISPFPWRQMLARSRSGAPLGLACAGTTIGVFIPILGNGTMAMILSAVIFGLCFFITPTAVSAFGRANLPESQWGRSVALFTVLFALGQIVGPVTAGALVDATDSLRLGLLAGATILAAASVIALLQRPLPMKH